MYWSRLQSYFPPSFEDSFQHPVQREDHLRYHSFMLASWAGGTAAQTIHICELRFIAACKRARTLPAHSTVIHAFADPHLTAASAATTCLHTPQQRKTSAEQHSQSSKGVRGSTSALEPTLVEGTVQNNAAKHSEETGGLPSSSDAGERATLEGGMGVEVQKELHRAVLQIARGGETSTALARLQTLLVRTLWLYSPRSTAIDKIHVVCMLNIPSQGHIPSQQLINCLCMAISHLQNVTLIGRLKSILV